MRQNPEGLQLIRAIFYLDMSGLKPVSLGSDLLQLSKEGPKWVLMLMLTISKRLEILYQTGQYWPIFSFGIYHPP